MRRAIAVQGTKKETDLLLTLRITEKAFTLGARNGTLPSLPFDLKALNDKAKELITTFPENRTLRVTVDPEVKFELLVKALDAVGQRDGKQLHSQLVVSNFPLPAGEPTPE